jgi:hypothetical protein
MPEEATDDRSLLDARLARHVVPRAVDVAHRPTG